MEGSQTVEKLEERKPMKEAVAATLAEAMSHAQKCLTLISAAQDRPGDFFNDPFRMVTLPVLFLALVSGGVSARLHW